jgi:FtsZ-binding cell division protein ZapB
MATDSDGTKFSILYKSQIMIVDKNKKIKAGVYINNNVPYSYHKLTIKIKNITENILLESEILDKLNTIQNIELENNELKLENNELKLENNELKLENNELKLENNELKLEIIGTNLINNTLKKEVEYYNSLKPEYDYKEMRQTKKNLHNEYKRIYKLIKQNIGFNLI